MDAQFSPALAGWLADQFGIEALPVRALGLRDAKDRAIFMAAREGQAVVMTKDQDFVRMLEQHGPPPQVIWVTCGNTSSARMREILGQAMPETLRLLAAGEPLVEISDVW